MAKEIVCQSCGKRFKNKRGKRVTKFCSRDCYLKDTYVTRSPQICKACGKNYYKNHESDNRSCCNLRCRSKYMSKIMSGKNSPSWRGGITDKRRKERNNYLYKEMQRIVWNRDDFTCVMCGKRGGKIEMHHIKPYSTHPEGRLEPINAVTLCNKCHNKTKGGKEKNFEYLFNSILEDRLIYNFNN